MFAKNISNSVLYIKNKIVHPNQIIKIDTISDKYKNVLIQVEGTKIKTTTVKNNEIENNKISNNFIENNMVNDTIYIPNNPIIDIAENDLSKQELKQDLDIQEESKLNNSVLNDLLQQILDVLKSGNISLQTIQTPVVTANNEQIEHSQEKEIQVNQSQPQINLEDLDPILANLLSNSQR